MKVALKHNGKMIGRIKEGVFRKRVKFSSHFCFQHHGWGIQREAFEEIKDACKEIRILDTDNNKLYVTTPQTYYENGVYDNLGDGIQIFLDKTYFDIYER